MTRLCRAGYLHLEETLSPIVEVLVDCVRAATKGIKAQIERSRGERL
jgi:hypothetical protein